MKLKPIAKSLLRNRDGAAAVIVAGSLAALAGAATVAVDFGSIFLAKRQLQGIADAAAMAAAGDIGNGGQASAQAIIDQSGATGVTIDSLTPGQYVRDRSVALNARFTPEATAPTAAHIVLEQEVPLFFGVLLSGERDTTISAEATATRSDMAAFSLGTRLAAVSGGLPNQILSQLAGTELALSVLDGQNLAAADVDILHFADALRVRLDKPDATYAELFDTNVALTDVAGAMADVVPVGDAADALSAISSKLTGGSVKLADLIDLGPLGQSDFNDGRTQIKVDAFSLLRSALELSHGDHYEVDLNVSGLGLASTTLKLVGGSGEVHSPWMTVTTARDVVIRTAQMRLYLDTQLGAGSLGLLSIRLPIYTELAAAEARLTDIECDGDETTNGVTLDVTPAVGTLAIADVDQDAMEDLTVPMELNQALLANTPLAQVKGDAVIALSGVTPQSVHFTKDDIANRRVQTVDTNDLVGGIATSLLQDLDIEVDALNGLLSLNLGSLIAPVTSKLTAVAPAIDTLLNGLTDTLGVHLGVAGVRVDNMRCGVPLLVA